MVHAQSEDPVLLQSVSFAGDTTPLQVSFFDKFKPKGGCTASSGSAGTSGTINPGGYLSQEEIQVIIDDAVLLAVRQEEQYVLMAVRNTMSDYRTEIAEYKKSRSIWIKVCAVETCILTAGLIAGGIIISKK